MIIQTYINCRQDFQRPARYVTVMLGLIGGFRPRFVTADQINEESPLLVYGLSPERALRRVVVIPESPILNEIFREGRVIDPSSVRVERLLDRTLFSLFPAPESSGTVEPGGPVRIHFDLIASALYFLALHEERVVAERDQFDRLECRNTLLGKLDASDRPVVSEYAALVAHALTELGIKLVTRPRFDGRQYAVCLTHDIDYLSKWSPGIALREFFGHFLLNRSGVRFHERLKRFASFVRSIHPRFDPYKVSLEKIMSLEEQYGMRGTFFMKAGGKDKRDRQYRLDDPHVVRLLDRAYRLRHEIGLHPSFRTCMDAEMWGRELELLEEHTHTRVESSRQHYLRFRYPETADIVNQRGMLYESTLGFAEMNGFRNGACHPFMPYDLEGNHVKGFWEVPLHVMDGTLQHYRSMNEEESYREITRMESIVARHKGIFTILIHNTIDDQHEFPGWSRIFERYLESLREKEVYVSTISNTVETFLAGLPYNDLSELLETIYGNER